MALPEIIKDIDARVIRPASTDNSIVRFDGTTGQIQNTGNIIDDNNNTIINGRITSYVNDPIGNFLIRNDAQKSSERFIDNYGNLVINLADRDQGTTYPFSQLVIGHYNNGSPVLHFGWGKNGSYESVFNVLHSGNVSSYAWTGKSNMTWDPAVNILCSGTNAEWSIDCSETSPSTGDSFFHIWSSNLGNSMIQCFPKDGRVVVPYKLAVSGSFIGDEKLSVNGNLYVQGSARISSSLRVDGSITNLAVNGGIYWNPYVESSSDPTDAASITLIPSGCLGGTELRIQQANDSNDTINFCTPTYLCANGKIMFAVHDNWLRINEALNFTGGVYFGGSVVRIDNGMFQIGDSGSYVAISTSGLQIGKGANVSGNSLGSGLELWNDGEGGNITIYSGNCGTYGSYSWNIDAFNGNLRMYNVNSSGNYTGEIHIQKDNVVLYGAAWNDYAEYRESNITQPGRCIIENGDDTLSLSTERLQRGAEIVSDTFGFAIGETDTCKTPIAASGRVLAYGYEDREQFKSHIGYPVCSGPNGTVSIMTDEEEKLYPSRIIGYVSAVPDYEIWGTGNVKVDGRIWIRIK